jgi:dTDP-4-amino-4,6-dideoxygalactose transaminase
MFPVATRAFKRVISLPIYPGMDDGAVQRVINAVLETANVFSS